MAETSRKIATHTDSFTSSAEVTAESLRDRIPGLEPMQAEVLRNFFSAAHYWSLRDGGALYFAPAPVPGAPGATFQLEADGVAVALELEDGPSGTAELHWSDYEGRSRLLAWSLAHESLLMRLSEGLGVALVPVDAYREDQSSAGKDYFWLDFAIDDAEVEAVIPVTHRGKLRLPYTWLPKLQDRAEQPFLDELPPALGRWRDLLATAVVGLAGPELSASDWRALRPGDVIVAGKRSRPPQVTARAAGFFWALSSGPNGWRADKASQPIPSTSRENFAMNEPDASVAASAAVDEDAPVRTLPVKLEFELGRLELTVGELATIQPGYIFALPSHLEGANVTIHANGRATGRGEVVAVGETLGVRLLSWH